MNNVLLATSFTPDYERGFRYAESLEKHCNVPHKVLMIGADIGSFDMPRAILQAGHFLDSIPECRTLIFTDADIIMHREIEPDEMRFIEEIEEGQISACPNKHAKQLWPEEVPLLAPVMELYGYEDVKVFNTGFVICRPTTYRMMFERFKQLWPTFNAAFQHYAKIQLCMCAAVRDLGIEWIPAPGHLCSHGHCGLPEGVQNSNPPTFGGRVICFSHRLID